MGRRSDHSAPQLMRLTVQAAASIVDAEGVRAVTVRRIAELIGYAPGTLYTHFRNLDEVFIYVNALTLKQLRLRCGSAVADAGDARAALLALGNAYLDYAKQHPHRFELLFSQWLDQEVPDFVQQNVDQLLALAETQLRLVEPDASDATLQNRVRALWSGIHGVCALASPHQAFASRWQSDTSILETLAVGFLETAEQKAAR